MQEKQDKNTITVRYIQSYTLFRTEQHYWKNKIRTEKK